MAFFTKEGTAIIPNEKNMLKYFEYHTKTKSKRTTLLTGKIKRTINKDQYNSIKKAGKKRADIIEQAIKMFAKKKENYSIKNFYLKGMFKNTLDQVAKALNENNDYYEIYSGCCTLEDCPDTLMYITLIEALESIALESYENVV